MDPSSVTDNPFAVLSFLAAPAILTNACTLLSLSTSNRLARASDRAREAAAKILGSTEASRETTRLRRDFQLAARRAQLLVLALRRYYFAAGAFAAATCVALLGAFAGYFHLPWLPILAQVITIGVAVAGVGGLVNGSMTLLAETRLALESLDNLHVAITEWAAGLAVRPEPTGDKPAK